MKFAELVQGVVLGQLQGVRLDPAIAARVPAQMLVGVLDEAAEVRVLGQALVDVPDALVLQRPQKLHCDPHPVLEGGRRGRNTRW